MAMVRVRRASAGVEETDSIAQPSGSALQQALVARSVSCPVIVAHANARGGA
jgi:hypothetical protein